MPSCTFDLILGFVYRGYKHMYTYMLVQMYNPIMSEYGSYLAIKDTVLSKKLK